MLIINLIGFGEEAVQTRLRRKEMQAEICEYSMRQWCDPPKHRWMRIKNATSVIFAYIYTRIYAYAYGNCFLGRKEVHRNKRYIWNGSKVYFFERQVFFLSLSLDSSIFCMYISTPPPVKSAFRSYQFQKLYRANSGWWRRAKPKARPYHKTE